MRNAEMRRSEILKMVVLLHNTNTSNTLLVLTVDSAQLGNVISQKSARKLHSHMDLLPKAIMLHFVLKCYNGLSGFSHSSRVVLAA